ncbi:type III secretion system chaperone [Cupriavidus gilardii]|uniref:type III secretion system chaperone n=1 Tax=Cupriavidus gilardii TaxID=82541 RepID=UPI001580533D|nr:type III secretion system chaperone [Cupriavidus gilardii]MCT9070513.1 type III secretion system chaperone [Cupriavidus gilardii]QKS61113.1 CesT family type III secretion system chaperone [Cupriavidus gilardii]
MNRLDGFDRLLAEFGESIGIPEMAFDEDGLCHIRVDEEYPITFRRDDDNHNLVLVGLIAEELPQRLGRELVGEMLATGVEPLRDHGAALGLEPQSGTLILHQTMPLAKIDRTVLETLLGNFILMQKDWSARIAGADAEGPDADPAGQAGTRAGHALPPGPSAGRPPAPGGAAGAPGAPGAKSGAPGAGQSGPKAPAKPAATEPRYHPHLHHR